MEELKKRVRTLRTLFQIDIMLDTVLMDYDSCVFPECEIHRNLQDCIEQLNKTMKLVAKQISEVDYEKIDSQ